MKSVVLERARTLRNYDLAPPLPGAGELVIRVTEGCVLDEDLDAFARGSGHTPRVFGSTAVGVVEQTETAADSPRILQFHTVAAADLRPGDVVAVEFTDREDGGLREYVAVNPSRCHLLPPEIPDERLPLLPDVARVAGALAHLGVEPERTLVVFGARARGVLFALCAMHAGVRVVLVDPVQARLSTAEELGIEHTINPIVASLPEEMEWVTAGRVDYIVDTTGTTEIIPSAVAIATPGTTFAFTESIDWEIPVATIVNEGLTLTGLRGAPPDYDAAVSLAARIELERLVSLRVPFNEVPLAVPAVVREGGVFLRLVAYSATAGYSP